MEVVRTVAEMHRVREELARPVAMMATLGGMHAGHEALLDEARSSGASVVSSLFLNPTQFNDPKDLERYPRDVQGDLGRFRAHQVDVVFLPSVEEMYPTGASTSVDPGPLASILEGAHRPGHFRGVATVVAKILTVIRPDIAVWGAKDAQQNVVIRRVSTDLRMAVEHRIVPTVRAPDGLALSSRNALLPPDERRAAAVLYAALSRARRLWLDGVRSAEVLRQAVVERVGSEPLVRLEYVSLADPFSLTEAEGEVEVGTLLSLAAFVGGVRLIDNVVLDSSEG